jgi:hypothetical protein
MVALVALPAKLIAFPATSSGLSPGLGSSLSLLHDNNIPILSKEREKLRIAKTPILMPLNKDTFP